MLSIFNIKQIVSQIKLAEKANKKVIKVSLKKQYKLVLDNLWKEGFIYGYYEKQKYYLIFLKYSDKGLPLLKRTLFMNVNNTHFDLLNCNIKQKHTMFLVNTDKGVFSSKKCIKKGIGGQVVIKL